MLFFNSKRGCDNSVSQVEYEAYKQGYAEEHEKRLALEKEVAELRSSSSECETLKTQNVELRRKLEDAEFKLVELQIELDTLKGTTVVAQPQSVDDLVAIESSRDAELQSDVDLGDYVAEMLAEADSSPVDTKTEKTVEMTEPVDVTNIEEMSSSEINEMQAVINAAIDQFTKDTANEEAKRDYSEDIPLYCEGADESVELSPIETTDNKTYASGVELDDNGNLVMIDPNSYASREELSTPDLQVMPTVGVAI